MTYDYPSRAMTSRSKTRATFAALLGAALLMAALLAPSAGAHAGGPWGSSVARVVAGPTTGPTAVDGLIAPGPACPGQTDPEAPAAAQEKTMRCMTNYAREASGLKPLGFAPTLGKAANRKAADMIRCDEFSHEACGRPFTYWMRQSGYLKGNCWEAGENIAFGSGRLGTVRKVFVAWMDSPGHRENILGEYEAIGIGLRVGTLEETEGAHVWTQEFGSVAC
jgi:uncharacterized protein YkwD